MKRIQVQIMNEDFTLLPALEAKSILNSRGFHYVQCADSRYNVSVKIKDLPQIHKLNGFHLLDDEGTEMTIYGINKILLEEEIFYE